MDLLKGKILGKDNKDFEFEELIKGADLIGVYFSAHWCGNVFFFKLGPCKKFTPLLSKHYKTWKENNKNIVIIFASSDHSQESFLNYYKGKNFYLKLKICLGTHFHLKIKELNY
jgi:hypothetical protein